MTTWAVPGAKVVCIGTEAYWPKDINGVPRPPSYWKITCPVLSGLYTLRNVFDYGRVIGVTLEEIDNGHIKGQLTGREPSFLLDRFRPVVPPRTEAEDTTMFLSLLKSSDPLDRALMLPDIFEL